MHHLDATPTGRLGGSGAEGTKQTGFVPQVPSSVMQAADDPGPGDLHRGMLEERLRDPEFGAGSTSASTLRCSSSSRQQLRVQW
jgi:hypothetical protein